MTAYRCLPILISILLPGLSPLAQELFRTPIQGLPDGSAGVGFAVLAGNDRYLGEETNYDQLPLFLYEGKRVFAYGNSIGVNAVRNDWFRLSALARARFTSIDPRDTPDLLPMLERDSTVEAGVSAAVTTPIGELWLTGVRDVVGRYDGEEIDLSYRLPVRFDKWSLTPWVSVLWQDEKLTNYYYGISEREVRPDRPVYNPGDARNLAYGLNTAYHFSDHFFVFANVAVEELDDVIAKSPVVDGSTNVRGFAGLSWVFGGDLPPPRGTVDNGPPLWSWRLHWAYQLRHSIFPLPMAGIVTPSRLTPDVTPTQFGLTLSRALRTGRRADLFARASVFRHFEEPFQDNFYSYTLAMAGVIKTFDNFTDDVKFRWGIGFGLNYVESIPGQEVQKLVNRRVDSSRLLVYLEVTADYALDRIFKSRFAEDCFIGAIITHRSGGFGGSELLGGVSGGSDWFGVQLECLR